MGDDKLGRLDPKTGQMSEVATGPRSQPRRIAAAPDGMMWITLYGNGKLAKVDPAAMKVVKTYDLPGGNAGAYAVTVDGGGMVWTTGNGNGTIGKLDPKTGQMVEYKTPSGRGGPHTLIITEDQKTIWFTMQSGDKVASIDTATGAIREYPSSGGPYGLALDKAGNVWFCRMGDNKMGRLDPKTGQMSEVDTGPRSRPRRVAAAPDGMLWITLYGNGKLAKLDPAAMKVVKAYQLPAGDAGAYAVTVDGGGMIWANEINTDTVVRLDPQTEQMRVIQLPSSNVGIRKMVTDTSGRLWYMGSHNGRLGVVE